MFIGELLLNSFRSLPSRRLHPYLAQNELLQWCKEKGIVVVAYASTGEGCNLTFYHSFIFLFIDHDVQVMRWSAKIQPLSRSQMNTM